MTLSAEIIRSNHLGVYFGLQTSIILWAIIFLEFGMPTKTYKKIETIVLYFVSKKILK